MKSILPVLALLSFGSVAFAGSEVAYSEVPRPAAAESTWYVGASVGHLSNRDEALYTLHLGANLFRSGALTHSLFAEVGYSEKDTPYDGQFIPVTLNYKLDYQLGGRFSLYAGLGVGGVWVDDDPTYGVATSGRENSVEFMAQAFAGIGYDLCSSFQLYAGNRYIWVDESALRFTSDDTGDDVVWEIGACFRF
jgi:opacity protein-like surface antigen